VGRRARYAGTHPRRFAEKYKELAPDRYPEIVERVRDRGATPAGQHVPILVREVLQVLEPRPGQRGIDATLGYGGHAARLLAAVDPGGALLGLDTDPLELPRTVARLRAAGANEVAFVALHATFAGLGRALARAGWDGADFVLADLGVSSMQLDDPARGFSFAEDGPLDMRMNPQRGATAATWLATTPVERLALALGDYADEPQAERVARALDARRGSIATTAGLADAVRAALADTDPDERERAVRRVFQAVRIATNDELGALEAFLRELPYVLRPGGRAAVIAFHSGEDRRVKAAFARGAGEGLWTDTCRRPVRAAADEIRANPRARSAKLRWARRA